MKKIVYCEGVYESWLTDSNDDEYDDEKTPYFEAGPFYLASDVDARIAELKKALQRIVALSDLEMRDGDEARAIASAALMER